MKNPKNIRVVILDFGKRIKYAPSTPATAPLAPIMGTCDWGLIKICVKAAKIPERK
jgi:hypothetical protein